MKYSLVIFASVMAGHLSLGASEVKSDKSDIVTRNELGAGTWYDKADDMIEDLAGISQVFYADAEIYRSWTNNLNVLSNELGVQAQRRDELLQQVYAEVEALKKQAEALQVEHHDALVRAQQEQFDLDGQKVMELLEVFDQLKADFGQTVGAQQEALFLQLEHLVHQLKMYIEKIVAQDDALVNILVDDVDAQ